jgi:cell division protein FtsZ
MDNANSTTTPPSDIKIKVLGVGGAGCNAVTHLARETLAGVSFAALNTDAAALARLPIAERLTLGMNSHRGLGTGGDAERGRAAAEEDAAAIRALCEGANVIILVAGLGGGTGTGSAPVIARIARNCNALVLGIALMPFDFEGARRQSQAAAGLQELKAEADAVICLSNQKLFKLVHPNTPFAEGLAKMNEFVAEAVRSIWSLIVRPALVPLGFANLCVATQGRHSESCLAIGRGAGENRASDAAAQVIAHPLIDEGALLADAATVLVSIVAGPGFSMSEVHQVMEKISRAAESAHIIMGAAIDDALGEALTVTVIAASGEFANGARFRVPSLVPASRSCEPPPLGTQPSVPPMIVDGLPSTDKSVAGQNGRARKSAQRLRQGQLPLEIISRGRFEKSEPTIHHGQDLDVPTYIRRGVALN